MKYTQDGLVSVVVPTYNRPNRLRRSVSSIIDQTYRPIEIIVVDDCSETPATDVLDQYNGDDITITIVRHEQNQGANAARNTGIQHSSGEFIAFLDDDDEWYPLKLQRQVEEFDNSDDNLGVVYSGIDVDRKNKKTYNPATEGGSLTKQLLKRNVVGTFSTVLVRQSVIDQVGTLDERFPSWQDKEWYVRLSQHCEFKPINEPLIVRHMSGDGHLSDDFEQLSTETYPLFVEKFDSLARSFGGLYYRQWRSVCAQNVAGYALRLGDEAEAWSYVVKAIYWCPLRLRPYIILLKSIVDKYA
jgi:glycosyltransferase involved in cell wall biosynthesis